MQIFGVTGNFGTGKTTVSMMLGRLGAKTIDCDRVAHKALRRKSRLYKRIIASFGKEILNRKTKEIDRKKLAKIVFSNQDHLKKLTGIIHPFVITEVKKQIYRNRNRKAVVIDAPLLIEANLHSLVDKLIVVKTKREIQIRRISKKGGFSRADILKRINCQIPLDEKIKLANYVIDNSGTKAATQKQVTDIWKMELNKIGG